MNVVLAALALFLVVNILAGLWRVARGPTPGDRLLGPQLFGTLGTATLLVSADALAMPSLRDVAFLLVLLAVATTAAFTLRAWGAPDAGERDPRAAPPARPAP